MELKFENVRSFVGEHVLKIKPITLLIGENSAGKSTMLGLLRAMAGSQFPLTPEFNADPFNLGTFDTIVSKVGRDKKEFFKIGYIDSESLEINSKYISDLGAPTLNELSFETEKLKVNISVSKNEAKGSLTVKTENRTVNFVKENPFENSVWGNFIIDAMSGLLKGSFDNVELSKSQEQSRNDFIEAYSIIRNRHFSVSAIAPVRTKPKRIYDYSNNQRHDAMGEHVPFIIDQLAKSQKAAQIKKAIEQFGHNSGLFKKVNSKKYKKGEAASPFEILIQQQGLDVNLMDVGYGVSQALPILVDTLQNIGKDEENLLLIQQPEVHLHPKAQAALGSFFADMILNTKCHYVVETHSDYIVDRIRIEIMKGKIKSDMVSLNYISRDNGFSKIHKLELDEQGNVLNVPDGYRAFFLEEETKFF